MSSESTVHDVQFGRERAEGVGGIGIYNCYSGYYYVAEVLPLCIYRSLALSMNNLFASPPLGCC